MTFLLSLARAARMPLVLALAVAASACASMGAPSVFDQGLSPRVTTLAAADKVEPVLKEVTLLVEAGALSDNLTDDIAQFGPQVRDLLAAYFDATEACVVVDGALQTDADSGRTCRRPGLRAIYEQLDGVIWAWALKSGLDTDAGKTIAGARLIVSLTAKPASGDVITGYRKEPDVPLAQFQARRAALRASFDALLASAAGRLKERPANAG